MALASTNLRPQSQSCKCKVCGGTALLKFGLPFAKQTGLEIPDLVDDCWYYECTSCLFLFTDALDDMSTHQEVYSDDYWSKQDPDWYGRVSETYRLCAFANELLRGYLDSLEILDFGCGMGCFVEVGRKLAMNTWGTDIIRPRFGKEFFLDSLNGHSFDIIVACEVIEHLPDPLGSFEFMLAHLKRPGVISFQTAYYDPAACGRDWWYLGPQNGHISLYSSKAFEVLADRLKVTYKRMYNNYPGLQAWLFE